MGGGACPPSNASLGGETAGRGWRPGLQRAMGQGSSHTDAVGGLPGGGGGLVKVSSAKVQVESPFMLWWSLSSLIALINFWPAPAAAGSNQLGPEGGLSEAPSPIWVHRQIALR